jgi:DNA topoisomerase-1
MAKNLVIVESPAKAKTIEKFLGKEFIVASSFGHISDLPSKELGVDVDGDFTPKYEVSKDKKTVVKNLKDLASKSEMVWLASDEDREGEAIAWHLFNSLKLKENKTKRIVFHEITESAIKKAVSNPRKIDYNLVDAQQARRVLDRIVGYELSPVLWRKIRSGLSAGRVQSVSVRLIVEKEREILGFTPVSSFKIDCVFTTLEGDSFKARLSKSFTSKEDAVSFLNNNINSKFSIKSLEKKPTKKTPAPPFTTSTLQQEASRKLYFSVSKTMTLAQRLYEAGLITYMRTDSVNLSNDAKESAKNEIIKSYGEKYSNPRSFKGKIKGAQDAHEAIRPTNFSTNSVNIDRDQARLYDLIWKRAISSQMSDANLERTNVKIQSDKHNELFVSNGEIIKFDGFLKVYIESTDEENHEKDDLLPSLSVNQPIENKYINATQRFSRPPYRYTEGFTCKKARRVGE